MIFTSALFKSNVGKIPTVAKFATTQPRTHTLAKESL